MLAIRSFAVLCCVLIFVAVQAVSLGRGVAASAPASGAQWLVVSDIHFNPFTTDSQPVYYGEDTNRVLLDSAVDEMHRADPNPPVVLILGDFLAHQFQHIAAVAIRAHRAVSRGKGAANVPAMSVNGEALAAMREIVKRFNDDFPRAQFFIVLGNNDDPCGDYRVGTDTAYLRDVARVWELLIERSGAPKLHSQQTFFQGGYYTDSIPSAGTAPKLRIIALNSVYWSFIYRNSCAKQSLDPSAPISKDPGSTEMDWLAATLAATPADTKNLVIMHIPAGIDAYSTAELRGVAGVPFLRPDYDAQLRQILSDPASRVVDVIAGHTHRTEFRTLGDVPLLIVPSISPVYHNAPTFFVLNVARGATTFIQNYSAYMYRYGIGDHNDRGNTIVGWQRVYNYQQAFGAKAFDADALRALNAKLLVGWQPIRTAGFVTDKYARCAEDENANFGNCAGVTRKDWILVVAFAVVVICAFVIVLGWLRLRGPSIES
jgi:predicted phosphodiesterase